MTELRLVLVWVLIGCEVWIASGIVDVFPSILRLLCVASLILHGMWMLGAWLDTKDWEKE